MLKWKVGREGREGTENVKKNGLESKFFYFLLSEPPSTSNTVVNITKSLP